MTTGGRGARHRSEDGGGRLGNEVVEIAEPNYNRDLHTEEGEETNIPTLAFFLPLWMKVLRTRALDQNTL